MRPIRLQVEGRSRRVSPRPLLAAGASLMAAAATCDAFGFGLPASSRLAYSTTSRIQTRCASRCLNRRHRLCSTSTDEGEVSEAYSALEESLEAEIQELEEEIELTAQSSTEALGEADDHVSASITEVPEELEDEDRISILTKLKDLFWLCRPSNFPVVTLFHALGVFLSARCWAANSDCAQVATTAVFSKLMRQPAILTTLISLILVTSTSMVTNDYYDARNGVDVPSPNEDEGGGQYEHYHPLANGDLPYSLAKTFERHTSDDGDRRRHHHISIHDGLEAEDVDQKLELRGTRGDEPRDQRAGRLARPHGRSFREKARDRNGVKVAVPSDIQEPPVLARRLAVLRDHESRDTHGHHGLRGRQERGHLHLACEVRE
ncbi:hypothetical protein THAOC_06554 [Thalassiosira oceanica]|uniref:Uncharacterized protein n=1 Tax=Thalassiosira oceanica TaxID=159749 RepID=K0TLL6_THAOC|nr:hypothetical protein THAOC_06554 [Thalassiosira oceanica]|eukprot:EJK71962.1 hypothetical protein THAOC_06554 [Thalassiosira oceanica]